MQTVDQSEQRKPIIFIFGKKPIIFGIPPSQWYFQLFIFFFGSLGRPPPLPDSGLEDYSLLPPPFSTRAPPFIPASGLADGERGRVPKSVDPLLSKVFLLILIQ
jgi:hypothetical protein